jgi:phospholipid/cholesterol/gamma-HCH transport system substrate-binding protein
MPTPAQKARIGGFVVLGIALLISSLIITVGFSNDPKTSYILQFDESVDGLSVGSAVKYRGLPIGRVNDMKVADVGAQIVVDIEVNDRVATIFNGAKGRLRSSGVVGNTFVQIEGGSPRAGKLPEGSDIPTEPSLTTQIQNNLPEIISDLRDIMRDLNKSIHKMELEGIVSETRAAIASIRQTAEALPGQVSGTLDKVNTAAASLQNAGGAVISAADTVGKVVGDAGEPLRLALQDVRGTLGSVDQAIGDLELAHLREELRETVTQLNDLLGSLDAATRNVDVQVDNVANDLEEMLLEVRALLESVDRDPSSLLFGPAPQEKPQR